jgi:hypothetical protein
MVDHEIGGGIPQPEGVHHAQDALSHRRRYLDGRVEEVFGGVGSPVQFCAGSLWRVEADGEEPAADDGHAYRVGTGNPDLEQVGGAAHVLADLGGSDRRGP